MKINRVRAAITVGVVLLWAWISGSVLPFGVEMNSVIGALSGVLIGGLGTTWAMEW